MLCIRNVLEEFSQSVTLELVTDSAAAFGASLRHGVGKMKHLQIKQLFVQEALERYTFSLKKIPRIGNVADVLTHHWGTKEMEKGMATCRMHWGP
eukprot:6458722-Amphidinium_carterae.2